MKELLSTSITTVLAALVVSISFSAGTVQANECWKVTGWSSDPDYSWWYRADVHSAECTTVPDGYGWTFVEHSYGTPPNDNLHVRMNLDGEFMDDWVFEGLLVFDSYDNNGKPIIYRDFITPIGYTNETVLTPYPPEQGVPHDGCRVRLRHRQTGNCIHTVGTGLEAINSECSQQPSLSILEQMSFEVMVTGNGYYYLVNEHNSQALYTNNWNGSPVYNWGFWEDPNMRFAFDASVFAGYHLHHINSGNCIYGNPSGGNPVHSWDCWDDPNMDYYVDIIECEDGPTAPCCGDDGCFEDVSEVFCEVEQNGRWNPNACGCAEVGWSECLFEACPTFKLPQPLPWKLLRHTRKKAHVGMRKESALQPSRHGRKRAGRADRDRHRRR